MEVNITKGDKTTVKLIGRLDTTAVADFDSEIAEVISGKNNVVFDCEELEYISSSGLRSILNAYKQLKAAGGTLELCNLQPAVKSVFNLTGFTVMLKIL